MHPSDYFNDFYEAVLTGNTNEAQSVIKSLLEHGDTVDAYRIVSQAMYEVGKLWQENSLSVAQEHLATAVSQFVITQLTIQAIEADQEYNQSVALFSVETNQHNLGIQIVRNMFLEHGFLTYYYGADIPNHHIISSLIEHQPDYICYSMTLPNHVTKAKELGEMIRNEERLAHTKILIGGYALLQYPELYNQLEHDYNFENIDDLHQWLIGKGD
ncbi:cobalamin B12-binding domain-containing protein [Alkalibacillus almallahensis]|uniref:cobalamin B12-binding domain-containing protein n=1 Tax=Alkalibacillus almallahensis TaxID=1379154 RepID=UPI00141E26D1|nr:cobalamin-dependent protein [Alkalibacillus almallahensis]NIK12009.1 methanogenic corrinoid protein MtbC1 [Alkalibacillus almallahensis]